MAKSTQPKVLIVDDIEANLVALEAQLKILDCTVVRAQSGNQALKELLQHKFALVLLDVQMPGMDGYEVATYAHQHQDTKDVPIIFVTAMDKRNEHMWRGYGSGAVDFLFKPIDPQILCSKVKVFLELYRSRCRLADEVEAHKSTLADLEAFNYSVSHDLRGSLRHLRSFSQLLVSKYSDRLDENGKEYIEFIQKATENMEHLLDSLLQLCRASRGGLGVSKVDLAEMAQAIAEDLRGQAPSHEVEFVSVSEAMVEGDPKLLGIALMNLLANAWKYTSKQDHPRIEFGVETSENDGEIVCFVRDNGAGFDPAHAEKLFQPFRRLHAPSEFPGTGLGLAITQRIVTRHAGRIWAESTPGHGATFFFSLSSSPSKALQNQN